MKQISRNFISNNSLLPSSMMLTNEVTNLEIYILTEKRTSIILEVFTVIKNGLSSSGLSRYAVLKVLLTFRRNIMPPSSRQK
jgi:hypothetical protein